MEIKQISISTKNGHILLDSCFFLSGFGIKGDLKGGKALREVVIYVDNSSSTKEGLCHNRFKPNLIIHNLNIQDLKNNPIINIGDAKLLVNKIGKNCFNDCNLVKEQSPCSLRENTLFCSVIQSGSFSLK